jgi:hypothetical protein
MERIQGIPVADIEQLQAQNTDMKALAERGSSYRAHQCWRARATKRLERALRARSPMKDRSSSRAPAARSH